MSIYPEKLAEDIKKYRKKLAKETKQARKEVGAKKHFLKGVTAEEARSKAMDMAARLGKMDILSTLNKNKDTNNIALATKVASASR